MKAVTFSLSIPFIIRQKPCFDGIKIKAGAENAGMMNREVVCVYPNDSFRLYFKLRNNMGSEGRHDLHMLFSNGFAYS